MHHARRHLQIVAQANRGPLAAHPGQQRLQGQGFRLEMDLQRADPRRDINHAFCGLRLQGLHQGMNAETQHQIQLRLPGFQQQVGIAGKARHQAFIRLAAGHDDRRRQGRGLPGYRLVT